MLLIFGYNNICEENVIITNGCWGRMKDKKTAQKMNRL